MREFQAEVTEMLKHIQKYQLAIAEVASSGEKVAACLTRMYELRPDNEHGTYQDSFIYYFVS